MGGNVKIGNQTADTIDIKQIDRHFIQNKLWGIITYIQVISSVDGNIWSNETITKRRVDIFSGSSRYLMDNNIDNITLLTHKDTFGDIDIQLPLEKNTQFHKIIDHLTNNPSFNGVKFIGAKNSTKQVITLWHIEQLNINIQIDFEFVDFALNAEDEYLPTEWSTFSHHSSWRDIQCGFKGVFHKMALRALCAQTLQERAVLKPNSKVVIEYCTSIAFSVNFGLREKLEDNFTYHTEIPKNEWVYYTDVEDIIIRLLSGNKENKSTKRIAFAELCDAYSFVGLLNIIDRSLDESGKEKFKQGFKELLFGHGAQRISNDEIVDTKIKTDAIKYMESILS